MCHSLHPVGGDTRSKSNNTFCPLFLDSSHIPLREASARPNRYAALQSINPQPWRFTNDSLGLPHAHSMSVCLFLWVSVVCDAFFSTCLSTCFAHAACFVFGSVFITTFWYSFFFFYEFKRQLFHGAYWCTHNPAHMPILLFHQHLYYSDSYVCVSKNVYAFPSSSIFIHIYRHIHMHGLCSVVNL